MVLSSLPGISFLFPGFTLYIWLFHGLQVADCLFLTSDQGPGQNLAGVGCDSSPSFHVGSYAREYFSQS